jgi:hypothetical protein
VPIDVAAQAAIQDSVKTLLVALPSSMTRADADAMPDMLLLEVNMPGAGHVLVPSRP